MKKHLYIPIVAAVLVITGCKKFEHGTTDSPVACDLCAYAEGIEGTYRGEVNGQFPGGSSYVDSVTMTVQQIFLNNNAYDDSTTMYFATTHAMDTQGTSTDYDTIQIRSADGEVWFAGGEQFSNNGIIGTNTDFWIRNDTINRKLRLLTMTGYTYTTYDGYLLKQ